METSIINHDRGNRESRQTNHEIFAATAGVLQVTEFYDLASPPVKYGKAAFVLVRSRNTQSNEMSIALRVEFTDSDGYEHRAFLDQDEIVSLEGALRYILQNRAELINRAKTYTEVTYQSRGGFRAGLYVSPAGNSVGEYMDVGNCSVFFHELERLSEVIDEALFKLESLRE
jgi:hypothetical protein